ELGTRLGHELSEQEEVRRTTARERGDHIEQLFGPHPEDITERLQHPLGRNPLLVPDRQWGVEAGSTRADARPPAGPATHARHAPPPPHRAWGAGRGPRAGPETSGAGRGGGGGGGGGKPAAASWGFTANTTIEAPATAAALSSVAAMPKSCATASRAAAWLSAT